MTTPEPTKKKGKIAFLFLIYHELNNPEIWRKFFSKAPPEKYNVYIHSKDPLAKAPEPFRGPLKAQLTRTVPTKWGGVGLIHATLVLLEEALRDPENTKFVLVSGACVPVKTFHYLYSVLTTLNKSQFSVGMADVFPRYAPLTTFLPKEKIMKHHQWFIITRKHAKLLITKQQEYLKWCERIFIPDEVVFLTYLISQGLRKECVLSSNPNSHTTWVQWEGGRPINYTVFSEEEWRRLLRNGRVFFARKFAPRARLQGKEGLKELYLHLE